VADNQSPGADSPIFTRTYDLLTWLLPASNHFPRAHRHDFTRRLLDAVFDLREYLEEANLRAHSARRERLDRADEALSRARVYLRLAARWGWLTTGQYEHVFKMVAEVGRLLGGPCWLTSATGTNPVLGRAFAPAWADSSTTAAMRTPRGCARPCWESWG
jgi:hypothetical protein